MQLPASFNDTSKLVKAAKLWQCEVTTTAYAELVATTDKECVIDMSLFTRHEHKVPDMSATVTMHACYVLHQEPQLCKRLRRAVSFTKDALYTQAFVQSSELHIRCTTQARHCAEQ